MPSPPLTPDSIANLLEPYLESAVVPPDLFAQLADYLELILKWNTRINLTAVRDPEEIVRRHFGESLFAGRHLAWNQSDASAIAPCDSLLDLGSGAGFPGIPIQLLHPHLPVTLAESRTRKAAFLREVIRVLGLRAEVWANRAEAMPPERQFHTVTLRAVDEMDSAVAEASRRASHSIMILGTQTATYPTLPALFRLFPPIPMPHSVDSCLWIARKAD